MIYESPNGLQLMLSDPPPRNAGQTMFNYGTIDGMMRIDEVKGIGECFVVNSIINESKGNGHFADLMGCLTGMCIDTQRHLVFEEVGLWQRTGQEPGDPMRFAIYLKKRSFANIGGTNDYWKSYKRMSFCNPRLWFPV